MNRRSLAFTSALALALLVGCSGASDTDTSAQEDTSSTASALSIRCDVDNDDDCSCDGPGPSAKVFTLTSFNLATARVSGVNALGQTITASFTSTTNFRQANLGRFTPGDPVIPFLLAYNTAVQGHTNVLGTLPTLINQERFAVHARVTLTKGGLTVRAFRPVP